MCCKIYKPVTRNLTLTGYGFSKDDLKENKKAILLYHRLIEAMKFGFAQYAKMGDPDFMEDETITKVIFI